MNPMIEEIIKLIPESKECLAALFGILGAFAYAWMIERSFKLRSSLSKEYHLLREMLNLCVCGTEDTCEIKKERKKVLEFIIRYLAKISDTWDVPIRIKITDISALNLKKLSMEHRSLIDQVNSTKKELVKFHAETRAIFEARLNKLLFFSLLLLYVGLLLSYPSNLIIFIFGYLFFAGLLDLQYPRRGFYSMTIHSRLRWMYIRLISYQIKYSDEKVESLLKTVKEVFEHYKENLSKFGHGHISDKMREKLDGSCKEFSEHFDLPVNKEKSFIESLKCSKWDKAHNTVNEIENPKWVSIGRFNIREFGFYWTIIFIGEVVVVLFSSNNAWNICAFVVGLGSLYLYFKFRATEGYFSQKLYNQRDTL